MKGSEVFERLMNEQNTVAISAAEAVRLHNFLKGMISVHEHVRKGRDEALAKLAAMESQEPVAKVSKGASFIDATLNKSGQALDDGDYLYAKPVPADKPAVAVPTGEIVFDVELPVIRELLKQGGHIREAQIAQQTLGYIVALRREFNTLKIIANAAPSHSQQSAKDNSDEVKS